MKIGSTKYYIDMDAFLQTLQREDFRVGIDTHLHIGKILMQLPPDCDQKELAALLMPIVCKSKKQQDIFLSIYNRFIFQSFVENSAEKKETTPQLSFWQKQKQKILNFWEKLQLVFRFFRKKQNLLFALLVVVPVIEFLLFSTLFSLIASMAMALFLIVNYFRKKQTKKKAVAKRQDTLPPGCEIIEISTPLPLQVNMPYEISQTAARLRTRHPLGVQKLDIEKTIAKTIRNLGAFTPDYKDFTQYTEYLVLIEADNANDHRAKLYDSFFAELKNRNIPAIRYFFRQNTKYLYSDNFKEGKELALVAKQNINSVLFVFAALPLFLGAKDNKPYAWTEELKIFRQAFLFLPFGYVIEAQLATALSSVFTDVLHADEDGFKRLEDLLANQNTQNFAQSISFKKAIPLYSIAVNTKDDILALPQKLHDLRLLKWIYACAIYPDFSWQLTLFLGNALNNNNFTFTSWQNIKQLARLDWFRNAYMPDYARKIILEQTNWLNKTDCENIEQTIRRTIAESKAAGNAYKGNKLTEIYDNTDPKKFDQAKQNIAERHSYITAELVEKLKNILFFDLPEGWNGNGNGGDPPPPPTDPDTLAWQNAKKTNTYESYKQYLDKFPEGKYKEEAQERIDSFRTNLFPETIFVKGGSFLMGSEDGSDDEKPIHQVTLSDYHIGKYPVTVGEFKIFMEETAYQTDADKGDGSYIWDGKEWKKAKGVNWQCDVKGKKRPESEYNHPVIHVSWNDAVAYCEWLTEKSRENGEPKTYRLPTEAEWEFAAGGGTNAPIVETREGVAIHKGQKWADTDKEEELEKYAWYGKNSNSQTQPVNTKLPNLLGIYHMSGNVWEWCLDSCEWKDSKVVTDTYKDGVVNPLCQIGSYRVLRGGGWSNSASGCRVAYRYYDSPCDRGNNGGFRLVCAY